MYVFIKYEGMTAVKRVTTNLRCAISYEYSWSKSHYLTDHIPCMTTVSLFYSSYCILVHDQVVLNVTLRHFALINIKHSIADDQV